MENLLKSNLLFLRESNRMSAKELGKHLRRSEDYINSLESGKQMIRISDILRISDTFSITVDKLLSSNLIKQTHRNSQPMIYKGIKKIKAAFNESLEKELVFNKNFKKLDGTESIKMIERLSDHHSKQYARLSILAATLIDLLETTICGLEKIEK